MDRRQASLHLHLEIASQILELFVHADAVCMVLNFHVANGLPYSVEFRVKSVGQIILEVVNALQLFAMLGLCCVETGQLVANCGELAVEIPFNVLHAIVL